MASSVNLTIASERARTDYADALTASGAQVATVSTELIIQTMGMGVFIGIFAGGFSGWTGSAIRRRLRRGEVV